MPFVTVHLTVAVDPDATPVTVVVGEVEFVIVAVPLINVHSPVPTEGVLCVIVKLPLSHSLRELLHNLAGLHTTVYNGK